MQENDFVKVYHSPKIVNGMYYYILKNMNDAEHGHYIKLDQDKIDDACQKLKEKEREIRREILELQACMFLIKLKGDCYYVNPFFVGKGDWNKIAFLPKFMVVEQIAAKVITEDIDIEIPQVDNALVLEYIKGNIKDVVSDKDIEDFDYICEKTIE